MSAEALTRDPQVLALLRQFTSVTEGLRRSQERLEAELREKNDLLRRRNRLAELGEMAAGIAHEIRNPLGGVRLYAGLLARRVAADPDAGRLAGQVLEGIRQLEQVVHDMLAYTRDARPAPRALDLAALVREAAAGGVASAGATGAARWDPIVEGCDAPFPIFADAGLLRCALENLVRNACEAMPDGGPVSLVLSREGARARIDVTDAGPGVPVGDRERIFDPFFTRKARGTGLGLAIVHRIVDAHGGVVRVGSGPSGGARFTVLLPPGAPQAREGEADAA